MTLTRDERRQRDATMRVQNIPIKLIKDNPYQTRKRYPRHGIKLLAKSISERGLINPIAVVKVRDHYIIVGGHRRLRAFKYLRRKIIQVIVRRQSTPKDLALDLAIENVLRKDFAPVEKGQAIFQVLCDIPSVNNDLLRAFTLINQISLVEKRGAVGSKFTGRLGFKASDVPKAERLLEMMAISPNTATAYLRLLDLPEPIQRKVICATTDTNSDEWLRKGFITVKMAYELSRIADNELRLQLFKRIVQEKIRYVHLKFIVDEILENGAEQFRNMGKGSARKREDNGMARLSVRCFRLGSSLWNYRGNRLPLDTIRMDRVIFRASLKQLRKSCLELVSKSNVLLKGTIEDNLDRVNQDFSLVMRDGSHGQLLLRYSFPKKVTELLKLKPSDKLLIKITDIERKIRKSPRNSLARGSVFQTDPNTLLAPGQRAQRRGG